MSIQLNGHDNSIINICFFCTTSTFYDVLHYILFLRFSCQLEIIYGIGRPPLNHQCVLPSHFPSVYAVRESGQSAACRCAIIRSPSQPLLRHGYLRIGIAHSGMSSVYCLKSWPLVMRNSRRASASSTELS